MKHSITKKVSRQIIIVLFVAIIILFIASFFLLNNIVYDKTTTYAQAILTAFSDTVMYDAYNAGVPLDVDFADTILFRSDYVCDWYDIDFAYMYVIDPEKGTVVLEPI